jgi:thymidylate synthase
MAYHFKASTLDDLMRHAIECLQADGLHISPTKGGCTEVAAASFELTNPRARVSRSVSRGRLFSALGELCWYLSGSSRTDDIAYYVKYYQQIDEAGEIFGAYGPRLFSFDGVDQINAVIQLLRRNPTSRRAVIQLFDHEDIVEAHADVPCTCALQYLLRDGQLAAITYMRSNDLFLGLPHDFFCFTMLQELIARSIGAEIGIYHHIVGSLHAYDQNFEDLNAFIAEGWQATTWAMPEMSAGNPWSGVAHMLEVERQLRTGVPPGNVAFDSDPYWADLERLLAIYSVRRGPREAIEGIRRRMSSQYYSSYIADRIDALALPSGT